MLKGSQKMFLKKKAHDLKPVIMIGQNGLSTAVMKSLDEALYAHELIKIKFVEFKEERKELTEDISKNLDCEIAGIIGNTAILFRIHPDQEKRKIKLPQ